MPQRVYEVLFLCTGNSARSILAEAILARLGEGRFRSHSAGSHPTGRPNPLALDELRGRGYDVSGFRSKSWDEFAEPGAPELDFVFTVCDNAAGETCPVWPGHPATAHWGLPDPAAVEDEAAARRAFRDTYVALEGRIRSFTGLSDAELAGADVKERLEAIAAQEEAAAASDSA